MVEKSHLGKRQKMHYWKMKEWKMHTLENDRIITHWNLIEIPHWKMQEWKMHNLENGRKDTPWKITENK